jgi:hypothetical protein
MVLTLLFLLISLSGFCLSIAGVARNNLNKGLGIAGIVLNGAMLVFLIIWLWYEWL